MPERDGVRVQMTPTRDQIAQIAHFLTGALLVLLVPALWPNVRHGWIFGGVALTLWVPPKEFWYDLRYEKGETVATSSRDTLFYALGALAAIVALWLTRGL